MYLLVVGFSEQNIKPISVLLQMKFKGVKFSIVPRQFSSTMQLTMPTLSMVHEQADGLIIDLEGVGLPRYDVSYQEPLLNFINNKPVILVSRRSLKKWQDANFLSKMTQFMQSPYDQERMVKALNCLQKHIDENTKIANSFSNYQKALKGTAAEHLNNHNDTTAGSANRKNQHTTIEEKISHLSSRLKSTDYQKNIYQKRINKEQDVDNSVEKVNKIEKNIDSKNQLYKSKDFSTETKRHNKDEYKNIEDTTSLPADTHTSNKPSDIVEDAIDSQVDTTSGQQAEIANNPNFDVVYNSINHKILQKYFPSLKDDELINYLLAIILAKNPIKVDVKLYQLFINPKEQSIIVNGSNDLTRLVDYFIVLNSAQSLTDKIEIAELDESIYEQISQQMMKHGYIKQSLHTLMWQIVDEVLSQDVSELPHNLQLRAVFMPNFSAMRFVPSYMMSLVSACLTIPRTLEDLQRLFPNLSTQQLNRFFLLALLSGLADSKVILPAEELQELSDNDSQMNKMDYQQKRASNQGIKKANKTGFFKRLLNRLSR